MYMYDAKNVALRAFSRSMKGGYVENFLFHRTYNVLVCTHKCERPNYPFTTCTLDRQAFSLSLLLFHHTVKQERELKDFEIDVNVEQLKSEVHTLRATKSNIDSKLRDLE